MFLKRAIRPLRRLRGKLTLFYTLTTVVTVLIIETIVIGLALFLSSLNVSTFVKNDLSQEAPQAVPYFVHGVADREALTSWLSIINRNFPHQGPFNQYQPIFLSVVDMHGQVIASADTNPIPSTTFIQTQLSAQSRADLRAVLSGGKAAGSRASADVSDTLVAVSPIELANGKVLGALVMKVAQPDRWHLISYFFVATSISVVFTTTIAAIAGMVFGSLIARGITRRLKRLSAAADRWSRGDFSAHAPDTSEDEVGQVARQLNRMAEQIQNLLHARQKLATLEERNRLARDLHDSVKQQIFAVVMQIGATRILLRRDVDAAEVRLNETEKLVKQAQQELTSLIRELRPVALEGKGLVPALREMVTQWAQQTESVANLRVEDVQVLPLTVEEALYRVAQEALSNVARHSKATLVQMTLAAADDRVTLSIVDNGQGFEMEQQRIGVGLLSMQERMKALGGDVEIESAPGKGTSVIAYCKKLGVDTADALAILHGELQSPPIAVSSSGAMQEHEP